MNYPVRKRNRLPGFDYSSANVYFITICTQQRRCMLWARAPEPVGATNGRPLCSHLSPAGMHVRNAIERIPSIYPAVAVVNYAIMPNHVHLLLHIHGDEDGRPMVAPTVSRIVAQMKGAAVKAFGQSLWQKGFHDHVVRTEADLCSIWAYIDGNPYAWAQDCFYQAE